MDTLRCSCCDSPNLGLLGLLGRTAHFRCRDCGMDTSTPVPGSQDELEAMIAEIDSAHEDLSDESPQHAGEA
jgi:hypothetical protein